MSKKTLGAILAFCLCSAQGVLWADTPALRRSRMIHDQLQKRGIKDERVLKAMQKVERHLFVPGALRSLAYEDFPLPIGYDQTISQPYIVAFMTEAAALKESDRVLEIGTGSGYQAAILAEIAQEVYSIEILKPLAEQASERLQEMDYPNIRVKQGNGYEGWPEFAPFDAILVTAAPTQVPPELAEQLKVGGRMVIPLGGANQKLYRFTKLKDGSLEKEELLPVAFVPMVHESESEA